MLLSSFFLHPLNKQSRSLQERDAQKKTHISPNFSCQGQEWVKVVFRIHHDLSGKIVDLQARSIERFIQLEVLGSHIDQKEVTRLQTVVELIGHPSVGHIISDFGLVQVSTDVGIVHDPWSHTSGVVHHVILENFVHAMVEGFRGTRGIVVLIDPGDHGHVHVVDLVLDDFVGVDFVTHSTIGVQVLIEAVNVLFHLDTTAMEKMAM